MKIKELKLKGVFQITLEPHLDKRGFFMRTYDYKILEQYGLNREWVQENHSKSTQKGIIRGLHFQLAPFSETKLIRAIRGKVMDVFVDLRKGSPTFGHWGSIILSEDTFNCAYIPRGFAHGFCTLSEISEVVYKVDNYYSPENERGIIWNDRSVNINWPEKDPVLSDKDQKNMTLDEFKKKYVGIET